MVKPDFGAMLERVSPKTGSGPNFDAGASVGPLTTSSTGELVGTPAERLAAIFDAIYERLGIEPGVKRAMEMKKLADMTESELKELCDSLSIGIERQLPPKALFALLVFDGNGITQYVSNVKREDMPAAFREAASRIEGGDDVTRE